MLYDLGDFGIVYRHQDDDSRFYPTRLATTLTSEAGALLVSPITSSTLTTTDDELTASSQKAGYIILETNHRLYAYTNSNLQTKILALFTKMNTRFPNLVSGLLTKASINKAISHGITSDQIISYISTHAHPQMLKNTPILPPTVVDQIRLWQLEENRMKSTQGWLIEGFTSHAEYIDMVKYAEQLGVLVWRKDDRRQFFVTNYDQLKTFLERRRSKK